VKIHRKAAMAECEGQEKRCAEAQPEVAPNEREQLDVTPLERCQQMMQRMAKADDGPTCPMGSTTGDLARKARNALWLVLPSAALIGGGSARRDRHAAAVRPQSLADWLASFARHDIEP